MVLVNSLYEAEVDTKGERLLVSMSSFFDQTDD